jgi:hypothetical protein
MSQVVAGISGKTDLEIVEITTTIHTDLTGNVYVPTTVPAMPAYLILINAAKAAIDDYNAEKTLAAAKKVVRDNAMAALKAATMTLAATVAQPPVACGSRISVSAGMPKIRVPPAARAGVASGPAQARPAASARPTRPLLADITLMAHTSL